MEAVIAALLYIFLAMGAYFYDFKGEHRQKKFLSFLIFSSLLISFISWQSLLSLSRLKDKQKLQITHLNLEAEIQRKQLENKKLQSEIIELKKRQLSSAKNTNFVDLSNLNVEYFQREIDPKDLKTRLQRLKDESLINQLTILDCQLSSCNYQSNALWYGSNVTDEQVREIAKHLISSRVNIKVIQRFFEPANRDPNLIQIGAERRGLSCRTWQKEEILKTRNFPENRLGCPE